MTLPTYYATGTASVNNGATTITFAGALLGSAELPTFKAGDLFLDPAQPLVPGQRLSSVDYVAGTAELWVGWPGTAMTADAYEVRFIDDGVRSTAQTRRYLERLGQLAALGIQPNAFGDFADRDAFDDEAKGFIFLSLDGDGVAGGWTVYIKQSATPGDWDAGQPLRGPVGQTGPSGVLVNWRSAWVTATDYALKDGVQFAGSSYICLIAHAADDFVTDLAAGKWEIVAEKGDPGDGDVSEATSRTALKALDTVSVALAYLSEAGREGTFVWRTGDYSSEITADTQEAIYIKADAIASTAGAWVRDYGNAIEAAWFGASPFVADNSTALNAALAMSEALGGGCVDLPVGTLDCGSTLTHSGTVPLWLRGAGRDVSIIEFTVATSGLDISPATYQSLEVKLESFCIRGFDNTNTAAKISNCALKVDDVYFFRWEGHLLLDDVFSFDIEGCMFKNAGSHAIRALDDCANNGRIHHNGFFGNGVTNAGPAVRLASAENISIEFNQFEGNYRDVRLDDCSSVTFRSNYCEYEEDVPINFVGTNYNISIVNNWFAEFGVTWSIENVTGLHFDHNTSFNATVSLASTALNAWVGDNRATGTGSLPAKSYREVLTANRTYYVRADGSDSHTGLVNSSGGAFLTIQKALNVAAGLDCSTFNCSVTVGPGTFAEAVVLPRMIGSGVFTLAGAGSTTIVAPASGDAVAALNNGTVWFIDSLKLDATVDNIDVTGAGTVVRPGNIEFAACGGSHINMRQGGGINANGNLTISGGAQNFFSAQQLCNASFFGRTLTLTGTPAFGNAFARAHALTHVNFGSCVFSGSATGARYTSTGNSVIDTETGNASFLPGNAAHGTPTASGGQYL